MVYCTETPLIFVGVWFIEIEIDLRYREKLILLFWRLIWLEVYHAKLWEKDYNAGWEIYLDICWCPCGRISFCKN